MPRITAAIPLATLLLGAACATSGGGAAAPAAPAAPRAVLASASDASEARCARGFAVACRDLGRAHLTGERPRDDRLAAAYATKACEIGEASGCADLGVLAATGRGLPQDDTRAAALERRACDAGSALGCSNLAVLAVEGAVPMPPRPDEPLEGGGRPIRLLRTACDAGVPEGCLNLGTVLAAGQLANGDPAGAARAFAKACGEGLALACHRLGLLAMRQPEAAPGADQAALQAQACRAAIAPACDLAKLPVPPASAATPTARLVSEPRSLALGIPGAGGFHPADLAPVPPAQKRTREEVRQPPQALIESVPPALRSRLGLAPPVRADDGLDPAIDMLVALRRQQLGRCYEVPRRQPGARTEVLVAFLVEADGHPVEVRAAAQPADAELEACAAEVVSEWEFPVPPGGLGGPHLARYTFESAPSGAPPQFQPPGGLRPSLKVPGCLEKRLRVPPDFRGTAGAATVKLAVDGNGAPILLHAVTPAPEPLLAAIGDAVRACEWLPGADASGRRLTLWVTVPVQLGGR
jgi:TPR repeat protein